MVSGLVLLLRKDNEGDQWYIIVKLLGKLPFVRR